MVMPIRLETHYSGQRLNPSRMVACHRPSNPRGCYTSSDIAACTCVKCLTYIAKRAREVGEHKAAQELDIRAALLLSKRPGFKKRAVNKMLKFAQALKDGKITKQQHKAYKTIIIDSLQS